MNYLYRSLRYTWFTAWYGFAVVAVLAALSLSAARLILPIVADKYDSDIELLVSDLLQQPVTVGSVDAEWRGLGPRLVLQDVLFLEPGGGGAMLSLDRASIAFDLLVFLRTGQLGLSAVSLSGFNLILRRSQDGSIAVVGMDAVDREGTQNSEVDLRAWLMAQSKLEVEHANVFWVDQKKQGRVWQFNDVRFLMRNSGDRHQVEGFATLPAAVGKDLAFNIDVEGNPVDGGDWQGRAYVRGVGLDMAVMSEEVGTQSPIKSGQVSFEVWSNWRDGQPYRLFGELSGENLAITHAQQASLAISQVAARFELQRAQDFWRLDMSNFRMHRDQRYWPDSSLHAQWRKQETGVVLSQLAASYLDIGHSLELAQYFSLLPEEHKARLRALDPNGILRNFRASAGPEGGAFPGYLHTEFSGISSLATEGLPGVSGLSGVLVTDRKRFKIRLSGSAMGVEYARQFPRHLQWDEIDGVVYGVVEKDYWQITSSEILLRNDELHGHAQFSLFWPKLRAKPFLSLLVKLQEINAAAAVEYLPVSITGTGFRRWWQRAVVSAGVSDASIQFSGWTDGFPFQQYQGKLAVTGALHNGKLDYASGWPVVERISGEVNVRNSEIRLQPAQGVIFQSQLRDVAVVIEDVTRAQPTARITGEVIGATQEKLDYLLAAPPLRAMFGGLDAFRFRGNSKLSLDLTVPTVGDQEVKLKGILNLQADRLEHRGALGIVVSDLTGAVSFTGDSVTINDMPAKLFDQNITINAATQPAKDGAEINFSIAGNYDAASLAQRFDMQQWAHLYQGSDAFSVTMNLPVGAADNAPSIEFQAQLGQVATYLPAPLRKDAGVKQTLNASLSFQEGRHDWVLRYGDVVNAALVMVPQANSYTLSHGEIVVGKGRANRVWSQGLAVKADLVELELDDWFKVLKAPGGPGEVSRQVPEIPPWLTLVQARIGKLSLSHRDYEQCELKLTRNDTGALLEARSNQLTGRLQLPAGSDLPLELNLDYWNIVSAREAGEPPDPNTIPPINIRAKELAYNGSSLGALSLAIVPINHGVQAVNMSIHSKQTSIKGDVNWVYRSGRHVTSIDMSIDSTDVGVSMSQLGYANTIDKGTGNVRVKADWSGAPVDPVKPDLSGEINLNFKDGRLLDLNPGAGKVLAILSLQMLPRRLLLDFSDMFKKGFSFQVISGDFSIQDADVYTTNLLMEGPSAKIHIAGRTGLIERDYDQLVTVIPDVTASIPVLAWWLVDPATGLIALALQKIFQNQIDDVVKFQYIITGTWEKPAVTKVEQIDTKADGP